MEDWRENLFVAVEYTSDAVFITDKDGIIKYVNPAFERQTGFSKQEVIGKKPNILKSGKHPPWFYQKLWETILSKRVFQAGMVNKRKSGDFFYVEQTITPVMDAFGEISHFVSVNKEVTERKQAEEEKARLEEELRQAQKMEIIGQLAGGIAHDFNNVITIIQLFVESALMTVSKDDPLFRDLNEIKKAASRAAALTRQLLMFSRRHPVNMQTLDFNQIIQTLNGMLKSLVGETISLLNELEPNLWEIEGDQGSLEQVVMNLVVNARDAMPQGGQITIKTENVLVGEEYSRIHSYARAGRFVCLSVKDTGIGIEKESIRRIFEPFFTTKGAGKGTGLGLSVVYGIVKQHGGWIDVESSPGKGAIFRVYLPALSISSERESRFSVSPQAFKGKGERILVVEDDKTLIELSGRVLRDNGYVVFTATNLGEALDIFTREGGNFDLVFSDLVLPDGEGSRLLEHFYNLKPEIKILFTSGYIEKKEVYNIIQQGKYPFLPKPYSLSDLFRSVTQAMKR
jgi:PAS domain S-box-containing protein